MIHLDPWAMELFAGAAHVLLALAVSAHIVLTKQDVRGAIGWVGLVWLTPVLGAVLYAMFGINRIRRQAGRMRLGRTPEPVGPVRAEPLRLSQSVSGLARLLRRRLRTLEPAVSERSHRQRTEPAPAVRRLLTPAVSRRMGEGLGKTLTHLDQRCQTVNTVEPVVLRSCRSRWARAASRSG